MNDEVRKAVEYLRGLVLLTNACTRAHVECIEKVLRDQEAEIARLNAECRQHLTQAMENGQAANKAEALLRHVVEAHTGENRDGCGMSNSDIDEITTHLGATQHD